MGTFLMYVTIFVFFVVFPAFFWICIFYAKDSGDKEPKKMIFTLFLWGLLSAILAVTASSFFLRFIPGFLSFSDLSFSDNVRIDSGWILFGLFLCVILEEFSKAFILWTATYYSRYFTQIVDGVLYGAIVGLGFSFLENMGYFFSLIEKETNNFFGIVAIRSVGPLLLHLVTTGIVGLYLGKKKFSFEHKKSLLLKGFFIAVGLHFVFNVSLFSSQGMITSFFCPALLIIGGVVYLVWEFSKADNRVVWGSYKS